MTQKKMEQSALAVSTVMYLVISGAGLWVWLATGMQALFLDFFFSFIALLSAVTAVVIAKISHRKTARYPDGLWILEPLYAILKSLLTLALLAASVISTAKTEYLYFSQGIGEAIKTGPVLPYAISMVILCFGLGFFNRMQNRRINGTSTILAAESKTNFVDGIQSMGVGFSIVLLECVGLDSALGFLHYTGDFFVTLILALLSVREPVIVLAESFGELSGAATRDKKILNAVNDAVTRHFGRCRSEVRKTGMLVRVKLFAAAPGKDMTELLERRSRFVKELSNCYENLQVELCCESVT